MKIAVYHALLIIGVAIFLSDCQLTATQLLGLAVVLLAWFWTLREQHKDRVVFDDDHTGESLAILREEIREQCQEIREQRKEAAAMQGILREEIVQLQTEGKWQGRLIHNLGGDVFKLYRIVLGAYD